VSGGPSRPLLQAALALGALGLFLMAAGSYQLAWVEAGDPALGERLRRLARRANRR